MLAKDKIWRDLRKLSGRQRRMSKRVKLLYSYHSYQVMNHVYVLFRTILPSKNWRPAAAAFSSKCHNIMTSTLSMVQHTGSLYRAVQSELPGPSRGTVSSILKSMDC